MLSSARWVSAVLTFARGAVPIFADVLTFLLLCFRSPAAVAAENLFLRKQLGLYIERKIKPRRATNSIRFTLAHLSRFFDWRNALTVVQPDTLIRWHRSGFRVFWKWKSRPRMVQKLDCAVCAAILLAQLKRPVIEIQDHRVQAAFEPFLKYFDAPIGRP